MTARREGMRPVHVDYLERNNYFPMVSTPRPPPQQQPVQFRIEEDDGYYSAEEGQGPSTTSKIVQGAKHIAKNYAWPFTRDILGPAAGELAITTATAGACLIGKTFWSLADIIWALNGGEGEPPDDNGGYAPIGYGGSSSSSSSSGRIRNGETEEDFDDLSKKGKGYLVEEIYKNKGWAHMFGREDANGYTNDDISMFRKRLTKMNQKDLAKVLIKLKRGS